MFLPRGVVKVRKCFLSSKKRTLDVSDCSKKNEITEDIIRELKTAELTTKNIRRSPSHHILLARFNHIADANHPLQLHRCVDNAAFPVRSYMYEIR